MRPLHSSVAVAALVLMTGLPAVSVLAQDAAAQPSPSPARAEIRPRVLVALGGGYLGRESSYLTYRWDGGAWSDGEPTPGELAGRPLTTLSVAAGVQTDWLGGYVLSRTGVAYGDGALSFLQVFALVVEVTLFDLIQIGVGPSLDILGHGVAGADSAYTFVGPYRPREAPSESPMESQQTDWAIAPGFEARVSLATGGGPDERRGFFVTPAVHLSFPDGGLAIAGTLELGLQSF